MKIDVKDIKDVILSLPEKEKDKLLISLLRKDEATLLKLYLLYVANQDEKQVIFEDLKEKVKNSIYYYSSNRGIIEKNLAKGITKANQHLNHYKSILSAEQEVEIYIEMLDVIFDDFSNHLGTCWTVYDYKVGQLLSKTINLINKKLHEDLVIDYEEKINKFLSKLKSTSSHLDFIYLLPNKISR